LEEATVTPEGRSKAAIKRWLDRHDIWYFMPAANGFGKVGIPDIICIVAGRFVGIEVKAPGKENNLTENQKTRIEEIQRAGGIAFVASHVETVEEKLAWLMK
jgi:Holliday junction resolvase